MNQPSSTTAKRTIGGGFGLAKKSPIGSQGHQTLTNLQTAQKRNLFSARNGQQVTARVNSGLAERKDPLTGTLRKEGTTNTFKKTRNSAQNVGMQARFGGDSSPKNFASIGQNKPSQKFGPSARKNTTGMM